MALIPKDTLKTFKLAKQTERDERILDDRKAIAKARRDAWIERNPITRKHALEDIAQALLDSERAETQGRATAEKCRGVANG